MDIHKFIAFTKKQLKKKTKKQIAYIKYKNISNFKKHFNNHSNCDYFIVSCTVEQIQKIESNINLRIDKILTYRIILALRKPILFVFQTAKHPKNLICLNMSYSDYLLGKKVVLVGPSSHMKDAGLGEYIDSFDVVIKMNRGHYVTKNLAKDIGSRCDVLYDNLSHHGGIFQKLPCLKLKKIPDYIKWICYPYPNLNYPYNHLHKNNYMQKIRELTRAYIILNGINFHHSDCSTYSGIKKTYLSNIPGSISIAAIIDILLYDIESLYITGLTFNHPVEGQTFRHYTEYYDKRQLMDKKVPMFARGHSSFSELKFMQEVYEQDNRITTDAVLHKILINKNIKSG